MQAPQRFTLPSLLRPLNINIGFSFLIVAQLTLGIAQLQIVPFGSGVDELYHFGSAKNVFAACLRDAVGLPWSLYSDVPWEEPRQHSQMGLLRQWVGEHWELIDAESPMASPCSVLRQPHYLKSLAYYGWVAAPMAFLDSLPPMASIPIGRFATLLLGLAVTSLAYLTCLEFFPKRTLLAMATATTIGLNHHMSGIMTGVNTDAGATFSVTLLLWSLCRIHRRGYSLGRTLMLCIALCLCLLTKTTAWVGLPVAAMWLWANLSLRWRWNSGVFLAFSAAVFLILVRPVEWSVPSHWFVRSEFRTDRLIPAARIAIDVPLGRYGLSVDSSQSPTGYLQFLTEKQLGPLRGRPVSAAGWVWAPLGSEVAFPAIDAGDGIVSEITIGTGEWQFQTLNTHVPQDSTYLAFLLPAADSSVAVHYDGMVLVPGHYSLSEPPTFLSPLGKSGYIDQSHSFTNLLRNPSAEHAWPKINFSILVFHLARWGLEPPEFMVPSPLNLNPSLWSVLSWQRTGPAWRQLPGWVFSMFWSGFGGVNPGLTRIQLWPLAVASLLSLAGLFWLVARLPQGSWQLTGKEHLWLLLLVLTGFLIWTIVPLRTEIYPNRASMFAFAGVRHALTGLTTTMTLFAIGLLNIIPRRAHGYAVATLALFLFLTSVYILLAVQIPFYECPLHPRTQCLVSVR